MYYINKLMFYINYKDVKKTGMLLNGILVVIILYTVLRNHGGRLETT